MCVFLVVLIIVAGVSVMLSYVKAPPSIAFIISGISKEPKVLIGSSGFRTHGLDVVYCELKR